MPPMEEGIVFSTLDHSTLNDIDSLLQTCPAK